MKFAYRRDLDLTKRAGLQLLPSKTQSRLLLLLLLIAISILPTKATAQLAASSWPKTRANLANTGSSTASGTVGVAKWSSQLQGYLRCAPAVGADGNIYVGDDSGNFYSINASTGVINWTFPIPAGTSAGSNDVETTPAIAADGTIYFVTLGGDLFALNPNGSVKGVVPGSQTSNVAPTIGPDGTVYFVSSGGLLTAFDPATVNILWSVNIGSIGGTPAIAGDGTLYVGAANSLFSLDSATGATKWSVPIQIGNTQFSTLHPPILTSNAVILTGEYDVISISLTTQKILWDFNSFNQTSKALQYAPAISPDFSTVYLDIQGTCFAIDAATGNTKWHTTVSANGNHAGVVIVGGDGTVYDGVDNPTLAALSPAGGILWQINLYNGTQETTADMSMGPDGTVFISPQAPAGGPGLLRAVWGNDFATLTFNPSAVTGGGGSTGTITLAQNQPADITFHVTAPNGSPITGLPQDVTVSHLNKNVSQTFKVGTVPVASTQIIPVSASFAFGSISGPLTVNSPGLSSFTLYEPTGSIVGGTGSAEGTVFLNGYAPAGGINVQVSSDNAAAVVTSPANVGVNANSAIFFVQTKAVTAETIAHITVSLGGTSITQALKIEPVGLSTISCPSPIVSATSGTGTIYLNGPVPSGTWNISISSSSSNLTLTPATVSIISPASSGTFNYKAKTVLTASTVKITATYNGASISETVSLIPIQVASVTFNPTSVVGLTDPTGTVTINSPAPTGGTHVDLATSNDAVAGIPSYVTVLKGHTSVTFKASTHAVNANSSVSISATAGGVTKSAALTVTPPVITSVTLNPTSVKGPAPSTGTVKIGSEAPKGGLVVQLSSNSSNASVLASVMIPAGATSTTFKVTTKKVSATSSAMITASTSTGSKSADLTIK
jgi:outer membrane protein assembly factor BamB